MIGCTAQKLATINDFRADLFNAINEGIFNGLKNTMAQECPSSEIEAQKISFAITKGIIDSNISEIITEYIIGYVQNSMINMVGAVVDSTTMTAAATPANFTVS